MWFEKIKQDTAISYVGISELRNGKRKVKNLTLKTAETSTIIKEN